MSIKINKFVRYLWGYLIIFQAKALSLGARKDDKRCSKPESLARSVTTAIDWTPVRHTCVALCWVIPPMQVKLILGNLARSWLVAQGLKVRTSTLSIMA